MIKNKAILAIGIIFLLVALSMTPASANAASKKIELCEQESNAVARLFDEIELAANTALNYGEFLELLRELFKNKGFKLFIEFMVKGVLDLDDLKKGLLFSCFLYLLW